MSQLKQEKNEVKIFINQLFKNLSSNGTDAVADTNIFSLNLIAGVSAGEKGLAFAGISSVIKNDASGMQFASFSNHVGKHAEGMMFAGFINIAKKVKGAQVSGFFNVADSSDYPIGIINLIKQGEKSIGVNMDENETSMLSFRSGGKVLYGIIAAGCNFNNTEEVYAFEAGIGAHFINTPVFRFNAELSSQQHYL